MIYEAQQEVDALFHQGLEAIQNGKLGRIKKIIAKLSNSMATSEAMRAEIILESYSFLIRRKTSKARNNVLKNMSLVWNDFFALEIVRGPLPERTSSSVMYEVHVSGGAPSLGSELGAYFSDEYSCQFLVLAANEEEAMQYINEIAGFTALPKEVEFRKVEDEDSKDKELYPSHGVYSCSPFFIEDDKTAA